MNLRHVNAPNDHDYEYFRLDLSPDEAFTLRAFLQARTGKGELDELKSALSQAAKCTDKTCSHDH